MTDQFEVRLSRSARADLQSIVDYVTAKDSRAAARQLLDKLIEKIGTLRYFPEKGSIPIELRPLGTNDLRQITAPPFRIFYRIIGNRVFVTIVADGRRDIQNLLERRLLGK